MTEFIRKDHAKRRIKPWEFRRRKTLILLGIPLVIFCTLLGARFHLRAQLNHRLDAIRAEGYPVTCQELDAWYPAVPENENAAGLYESACKAYKGLPAAEMEGIPFLGDDETPPGQVYPAELVEKMARVVEMNAEAYALLHQAAARPQCRHGVDSTEGLATNLGHLASLRQDARLLALKSVLEAERDNAPGAVDPLLDAFAVARSVKEEPILISQLVAIACRGISVFAIQRVLSRTPLAEEDMARLEAALREYDNHYAARRAYAGERALAIPAFRNPSPELASNAQIILGRLLPGGAKGVAAFRSILGVDEVDLGYTLDMYDRWMPLLDKPWPEAIKEERKVDESFESMPPALARLTRQITPALGRTMEAFARDDLWRDLTFAAFAVERYRRQKGALPDRLEELVPGYLAALPIDPFDGQPIRYRKADSGYRLYSVGENRIDDGGQDESFDSRRARKDWVFTVAR